jgi:hypothetical protein
MDTKKIFDYVNKYWANLVLIMIPIAIIILYRHPSLGTGNLWVALGMRSFIIIPFILFFILSLLLAIFEKIILRNDPVALSTSKMSLINFFMIIGLRFALFFADGCTTLLHSLGFLTLFLLLPLLFVLAKSCFIILFYKETSVKWKLIMLNIAFVVLLTLVAAKVPNLLW